MKTNRVLEPSNRNRLPRLDLHFVANGDVQSSTRVFASESIEVQVFEQVAESGRARPSELRTVGAQAAKGVGGDRPRLQVVVASAFSNDVCALFVRSFVRLFIYLCKGSRKDKTSLVLFVICW